MRLYGISKSTFFRRLKANDIASVPFPDGEMRYTVIRGLTLVDGSLPGARVRVRVRVHVRVHGRVRVRVRVRVVGGHRCQGSPPSDLEPLAAFRHALLPEPLRVPTPFVKQRAGHGGHDEHRSGRQAFRLCEIYWPAHTQHAGRLDDFFLLVEQAFARTVGWHDKDWPLPGARRVRAPRSDRPLHLADGPRLAPAWRPEGQRVVGPVPRPARR
jgi:hypothetical protein